jgi:hypothetical protein
VTGDDWIPPEVRRTDPRLVGAWGCRALVRAQNAEPEAVWVRRDLECEEGTKQTLGLVPPQGPEPGSTCFHWQGQANMLNQEKVRAAVKQA